MPFNQKRAKAGRAGRMSGSRALGIAIMVLRNTKEVQYSNTASFYLR